MVKLTPPMGWNSWNTFGPNISESLIMEIADAMVEKGLRDAGYEYVIIDDYWALPERGTDGKLIPDPEKFPHGMKYVGDYIHSKGLKFGIYSCCGVMTCAGQPSSFNYEFVDAETFAEWGVDYLKYDNCYKPESEEGRLLYRKMGLALENCGRDILFSACNWGADNSEKWIKEVSAQTWRSTGDINDSWASIKDIIKKQVYFQPYNGLGCFNDMDMLVCGMNGDGNVGAGGCSELEYRSHFAMWCYLASPLILGCDIRNISDEMLAIITNKELIAINQDPAARQAYTVRSINGDDIKDGENLTDNLYWVKHLEGGDIAFAVCNLDDNAFYGTIMFSELGLDRSTGKALDITNVVTGEHFGIKHDYFAKSVKGHEVAIYRCKVIDAQR